jgi:hypothetical protein
VTETAGQTLIFRWDAALLTDPTAAGVEVRVSASGAFPGIGLAVGVELGALAWDTDSATAWNYDSGWLASPFVSVTANWGGTAADVTEPAPVKNLHYVPLTPWTVTGWVVMFSDDQVDTSYSYSATKVVHPSRVKVPAGYAQAGVAVCAGVFMPSEVNFARGPLVAARDPSPSSYTLGGQEVGSRRRPRRALPVTLPQLTEQEGRDLFERVDWRKGKKLPLLVAKYPDGSPLTTLWATMEDMPGLAVPPALGKHSWSALFVEKL